MARTPAVLPFPYAGLQKEAFIVPGSKTHLSAATFLRKVLKLIYFFFFLIRDMTTRSSSLSPLFPTGKGVAEKKTLISNM